MDTGILNRISSRPIQARFDLVDVGGTIEERAPQLGERCVVGSAASSSLESGTSSSVRTKSG
jgi:hypothetical protein